jgi:glutamate dehydrogenase
MAETPPPANGNGNGLPVRTMNGQPMVHNRLLDHVVRTPNRMPSPQPTHLAIPGSPAPRVLHEKGSGYVAPKFEGKAEQMEK